jgi:hypothetical protein
VAIQPENTEGPQERALRHQAELGLEDLPHHGDGADDHEHDDQNEKPTYENFTP